MLCGGGFRSAPHRNGYATLILLYSLKQELLNKAEVLAQGPWLRVRV